jgi:hypothetical protein
MRVAILCKNPSICPSCLAWLQGSPRLQGDCRLCRVRKFLQGSVELLNYSIQIVERCVMILQNTSAICYNMNCPATASFAFGPENLLLGCMGLQHGCMCPRRPLDHLLCLPESEHLPAEQPPTKALTAIMFRVHESTISMLYRLNI